MRVLSFLSRYLLFRSLNSAGGGSGADPQGPTDNEVVAAYGQPGLDYSLDRHPARNTMYPTATAHHMMQHAAGMPGTGKCFFSSCVLSFEFCHAKWGVIRIYSCCFLMGVREPSLLPIIIRDVWFFHSVFYVEGISLRYAVVPNKDNYVTEKCFRNANN